MGEKMTWDQRAKHVIAQGCNTYSKRSDQFVYGVYPTHQSTTCLDSAAHFGSHGRKIDFISSLGANYSGNAAVGSLPYEIEVILAEMLVGKIACVDKVKMLKTGSAACEASVRIGRAWLEQHSTADAQTFGIGYHGCHNIFVSAENPGAGCRDEGYRKFDSMRSLISELRCSQAPVVVIVEPIHLSATDDDRIMLEELRSACDSTESILIFDETITFGRVPNLTVSNWWGIHPDITVFGKSLGDGYPINVVGGRADIMDNTAYFISNTHNGEYHAIKAAINNLNLMENIPNLWYLGGVLQMEFNKLSENVKLVGYPTRMTWDGDWPSIYVFWQEMCRSGYLLGRAFFVNHAHTAIVIDEFLHQSRNCFDRIKSENIQLDGIEPQPIFKRY